jgi:hypothetical protein
MRRTFQHFKKNIGLIDGRDWDDVATLVVDPGNKHSQTAVAVFVSGLKLGHVPEVNAPGVYKFLMQNGRLRQSRCRHLLFFRRWQKQHLVRCCYPGYV